MKARRIMFFIPLNNEEDIRKWKELEQENPGWKGRIIEMETDIIYPETIVIPNMTFDCAEVVDEKLKEKGLERTWLKDNEPEYYVELSKLGLA